MTATPGPRSCIPAVRTPAPSPTSFSATLALLVSDRALDAEQQR
jgi:hypothetical protein